MSRSRSQHRPLWSHGLGLVCGLLLASGCDRAARSERPLEGALFFADTRRFEQILGRLEEIEGTPLARRAQAIREALPDCPAIFGRAASGSVEDLWSTLRCLEPGSDPASLGDWGAVRDLALSLPSADGRIVSTLEIAANGDLEVEIKLPGALSKGLPGLALPGSEPPGATRLSGSQTLIHARVRPETSLDLSSLIPANGRAAQLLRLEGQLFAGVVLEGVWEIAVYLPEQDHPMPRVALALDVVQRLFAVSAMERFIDELRAAWRVERSAFRVSEAEGACLLDLKLLPDLAPCYVATDHALIVGWNPASIRVALDRSQTGFDDLGESGGAIVHLERFEQADRVLSQKTLPPKLSPHPNLNSKWTGAGAGAGAAHAYPWRRVVVTGHSTGGDFQLRVRFESRKEV